MNNILFDLVKELVDEPPTFTEHTCNDGAETCFCSPECVFCNQRPENRFGHGPIIHTPQCWIMRATEAVRVHPQSDRTASNKG